MASGCALLDLSPFTKIDVSGPDALGFLDRLATARIDVEVGRCVYSLMLNARGGIEADVTITRLAPDRFRIVSGAATRRRDLALLRRAVCGQAVQIRDVTEDDATIGVMGEASRQILSGLSSDDWTGFAFSTMRNVTVAGVACAATRLSYVGERGWELTIPGESAGTVFDALIAAGARPMGHFALNGCRIEKGYPHWGHDLGPEVTPLEAGLGFAVDWRKDFIGKERLEQQRRDGVAQRLVLLSIAGDPLILHDEPVIEDGVVIGLTTSGAKGVRTGLTLALALIRVTPGERLAETAERSVAVEVAGRTYPARILPRPPYDPAGERMRA